jgi:hypothetical protein
VEPGAVGLLAHDLVALVDTEGRHRRTARAARDIHRAGRKMVVTTPLAQPKPVRYAGGLGVGADDFAAVVEVERDGSDRAWHVDRPQRTLAPPRSRALLFACQRQ